MDVCGFDVPGATDWVGWTGGTAEPEGVGRPDGVGWTEDGLRPDEEFGSVTAAAHSSLVEAVGRAGRRNR